MSAISEKFKSLRENGRKALMPYVVAGFPSMDITREAVVEMAACGADFFEMGIPFSDPVSDGPTIQKASFGALRAGVNTDGVFDLTKRITGEVDVPLIVMCYYNLIYRYGVEKFAVTAAGSGIAGVIVPDLPPEEAGEWLDAASRANLDTVFLVSPTTSDERLREIADTTTGFLYCVSLLGVTGARESLPSDIELFLKRVRKATDKPLAVGFGISTLEQALMVSEAAEGVVIGSAIVDLLSGRDHKASIESLKNYLRPIASALHNER